MKNNNFGIDRIVLRGFEIESIDWYKVDRLYEKVKVNSIGKYLYFKSLGRDSNRDFSSLQISDYKNLKKLSVGIKPFEGNMRTYVYMEIISSTEHFRNLYLNSLEDINYKMDTIIDDLEKNFGIKLVKNIIAIREIEIANNIYLDVDFKEYSLIFKTIATLYSSNYKPIYYKSKKTKEIETILLKSKSIEFKMYNKSKQMEINYGIKQLGNILRMEFTLQEKNIKYYFGKSEVALFTDFEIKEWFLDHVQKNIKNQIDKHFKNKRKEYVLLFKQFENSNYSKKIVLDKINNDIQNWSRTDKTEIYPIDILHDLIKNRIKNFKRAIENIDREIGGALLKKLTELYKEISNKIYSISEK